MRRLVLAACCLTGWVTAAAAFPAGVPAGVPALPAAPSGIVQVQMQCTPQSCIDPRTGVYTQSTCDARGCRPSSGPVGRLGMPPGFNPQPLPGYAEGPRRPPPPPPGYDGSGPGWDRGDRGDRGWDRRERGWDRRDRDWDDRGPGRRRGYDDQRFDCNASRCVEIDSGRLWESTCDRRGCRPLRPARGQRW
ncbi:hypothetical protein ABE438_20220 [Bosea sp. TWI1241]|uniref:hypothetical protein n=1 Tax=Bosea sp. TWI1241 TaxID=3148904 RepID=UPI003209D9D3